VLRDRGLEGGHIASSLLLTNPIDGETMNHIILIGNVGRDPEARGADGGIAKFSLAVDSRKKGGEKDTQWFNCVAFRRTAEAILNHVKKGDTLAITGKLKTNTWEKNGVKQLDVDVVVDTWQFVSSKQSSERNAISNQGPATWSPDGSSWP
jgi:single-strand DNA-binding protein